MNIHQHISYMKAMLGILHGNRAFSGPIEAGLALTNRGNLRCIHCYFYSPYLDRPNLFVFRRARQLEENSLYSDAELQQLQQPDADPQRTNAVIEELLKMGTRRFRFTGSGEPFLHPHALEFMDRAKHYGESWTIVNTNGVLLDRTTIDALVKMRFNDLRITTLAGTSDVYQQTHPGSSAAMFEELTEHLMYLAEQKAAQKKVYPKVTIVCVVIPMNVADLFNFAQFARKINADVVHYRPFDAIHDPGLAKLVLTSSQAAQVREQLHEVKSYLASQPIRHNIDYFLNAFQQRLDTANVYRVISCYYGWLATRIDVDGLVYPCCRCYEPLGNIHAQSFQHIWNDEKYRMFRKAAKRIQRENILRDRCDCDHCPHYIANLRADRMLHPFRQRSIQKQLTGN